MPAMLSKLYHALLGAGVDDATATVAAEEAAQSGCCALPSCA